jgi:hypothetical protein
MSLPFLNSKNKGFVQVHYWALKHAIYVILRLHWHPAISKSGWVTGNTAGHMCWHPRPCLDLNCCCKIS